MNCLSVFDHFVGLAVKGLEKYSDIRFFSVGVKWIYSTTWTAVLDMLKVLDGVRQAGLLHKLRS